MTWQKRGQQEYLYSTRRTPEGRVEKVYLGRGAKAVAAAAAHTDMLRRRAAEAAAAATLRLSVQSIIAWTDAMDRVVDGLTRERLHAAGFHRARGEWRRRREPRTQK